MGARRTLGIALGLLGLAGCIGKAEPIDDGRYDPEVGNLFEGPLVLSDQRVLEMRATQLPATPAPCDEPQLVVVTNIVDGDTVDAVRVFDGEDRRLRLIGVDTPETAKLDPASGEVRPGECFGDEAYAFTELLRGRHVWITYDAECRDSTPQMRDLVYLWVGPGPGDMWNRQLVRRGLADTLTIEPNSSFAAQLDEDLALASSEGRGLWSACD